MVPTVVLTMLLAAAFFGGVFYQRSAQSTVDNSLMARRLIEAELNIDRLRTTHKLYSSRASLSGTEDDYKFAVLMRDQWQKAGLDEVKLAKYDVFVSYPDRVNVSHVTAFAEDGSVLYYTDFRERCCYQEDEQLEGEVEPPYIPYSRSGTAEGELIYGNLCNDEDLTKLIDRNAQLNSSILLCRLPRLDRCKYTTRMINLNVSGILCFRDPRNVAPEGMSADKVYPNTMWMPPDASFRYPIASVGDASSAYGKPSLPYFPRDPVDPNKVPILVQLLGYGYALKLLSYTNLSVIPEEWWMPQATKANYSMIPEQNSRLARRFRLSVNLISDIKPIYNVLGIMKGNEEPNRYVVFGNHKDSFHYGAVDSKSSTAALTEIVRACGSLHRTRGWRPRRTLVFAAWSGEEPGLIGSYEFVEHFQTLLSQRTLVYVNTDTLVTGNRMFTAGGSPLLESLLYEVARQTDNPNQQADGGMTLYDSWLRNDGDSVFYPNETVPRLHHGVGMSDYVAFFRNGIPYLEGSYRPDGLGAETYHTGYDTHNYIIKFLDPTFQMHFTVLRFYASILMRLSNDVIVPFTLKPFVTLLRNSYVDLQMRIGDFTLNNDALRLAHSDGLKHLSSAVDDFVLAAQHLDELVIRIKRNPSRFSNAEIIGVNEKLTFFDRNFVDTSEMQRIVVGFGYDPPNAFVLIEKALIAGEANLRLAYAKTIHAIRSATSFIHTEHFASPMTDDPTMS